LKLVSGDWDGTSDIINSKREGDKDGNGCRNSGGEPKYNYVCGLLKIGNCGCWDSSPGLHGHNVEFSPLNYSHFCDGGSNKLYLYSQIIGSQFIM
jgi:hypothetical protein